MMDYFDLDQLRDEYGGSSWTSWCKRTKAARRSTEEQEPAELDETEDVSDLELAKLEASVKARRREATVQRREAGQEKTAKKAAAKKAPAKKAARRKGRSQALVSADDLRAQRSS